MINGKLSSRCYFRSNIVKNKNHQKFPFPCFVEIKIYANVSHCPNVDLISSKLSGREPFPKVQKNPAVAKREKVAAVSLKALSIRLSCQALLAMQWLKVEGKGEQSMTVNDSQ